MEVLLQRDQKSKADHPPLILKDLGISRMQFKNWQTALVPSEKEMVSSRFELGRRRLNLSWSHHKDALAVEIKKPPPSVAGVSRFTHPAHSYLVHWLLECNANICPVWFLPKRDPAVLSHTKLIAQT